MRWLTLGVASVVLGGCGDHACFEFSDAQGGICPPIAQAADFFGRCSNIETIDGDGTFKDGRCCYPVTKTTHGLPCAPTVLGTGGRDVGSTVTNPSVVSTGFDGPFSATSTHVSHATTGQGGFGGAGGAGGFGGSAGGPGSGGSGGQSCDALACGFVHGEPLMGCLACARDTTCASEADACTASADCLDYESCFAMCSLHDPSCIEACKTTVPAGAAIFEPFIACAVCSTCEGACTGKPVHALTTCGGGGGGGAGGSGGAGGRGGNGGGGAGGAGGRGGHGGS